MGKASRAPTAEELGSHPVVRAALDQAWTDSLPDDPEFRHEEGGWIYLDTATGEVSIRRASSGAQSRLNLDRPPVVSGSVIVGVFHTHPNPSSEGWEPGPSESDRRADERDGVPDLIRADNGIHFSGPASRRGGLSGGPGFPP
jgi:hypothetical protein